MAFCVTLAPLGTFDPTMLLPAFNTIVPDVLTGPLIVKMSPVAPAPEEPAVKVMLPPLLALTPAVPMVNGLCATREISP